MSKTLAEIRKSPSVGLPERTYPLCLAGKLAAEIEELEAELDLIEDRPRSSGRLAAKSPQAVLEGKIDALREEMNEHLVAVRFRAKPGHEWRAFVNARPAREDEFLDKRTGVNVDKAIAAMDEFVVSISGEPLGAGDWQFIIETAADGDLKACLGMLIDLHNKPVSIPKSRKPSPQSQEQSSD